MNEYNLIIEARNKNEQAINLLLSKYYNNIKAIVFKYKTYIKNSRLEYSDILQEALLAFFKSIESYEVNEKVKFNTYFNSVIDRKIRDYIRKNNSKKEKAFNQALSLEDEEKSIYKFLSNNEKNPLNLSPSKSYWLSSSRISISTRSSISGSSTWSVLFMNTTIRGTPT